MDEKCVVVSNLSSFFYKCMVPEQQEPVPMEIEEPEEYGQLGFWVFDLTKAKQWQCWAMVMLGVFFVLSNNGNTKQCKYWTMLVLMQSNANAKKY